MQVKKLHEIIDKDTGNEVGYTVEGVLGRLLIYLYKNGDKNREQLHGETHNFKYYCIIFGWNYELKDVVPESTATKTKTYPFILISCLEETIESVIDHAVVFKGIAGVFPSETDLKAVFTDELDDRGVGSDIKCISLLTRSYPIGNSMQTEVSTKLSMALPVASEKDLKIDLLSHSEITGVVYDRVTNTCYVDFLIVY